MANIFTRIKDSIEADLHDVLDKKGTKKSFESIESILAASRTGKGKSS